MALPEDRTIPVGKFPEKVRRFVGDRAPTPMKMMVARGMVPMKPLVQVCALYQLAVRDGGDVAREAARTVKGMPPSTLKGIAAERIMPVVLDWLAELFEDTRDILQPIVLNKMTDTDTLTRVASETGDTAILELIANNQARLLEAPALIEALYFNRAMRASSVDRMLDFAARNQVKLPRIPNYEQVIAAIAGEIPQTAAEAAAADAKFAAAQAALNELTGKSDAEVAAVASAYTEAEREAKSQAKSEAKPKRKGHGQEAEEEEGKRSTSAAGRIRELNVAQKVRLAMMGNATERGILIRDTNKIVARSVIRSPAVSDGEALGYAKNKSLLDEVITYIANNKKWVRHYRMKMALVMNPKTPLADALRFMTHLRTPDLRAVARSKGIPAPVAKSAKQMIKARMK